MTPPAFPKADPAMPYMAQALDAGTASHQLAQAGYADARVEAARLIRHKPGRRFLVEYDVVHEGRRFTLIGKSRAKGLDRHSYEVQAALGAGAFGRESPDQISVPATAGLAPAWNMWLQQKVDGQTLTDLLATSAGPALAARAADAVLKLQRSGVPPRKPHGIADELRILHDGLDRVVQSRPDLAPLLTKVRDRCDRCAATLPQTAAVPTHRDFYPDQALVHRGRLFLIDFDLYASADPHLDMANFLAHVTEASLRRPAHARALAATERAMAEQFLANNGVATRRALAIWKWLSLARHAYISTLFPERAASTEAIIRLLLAADDENLPLS